ncbi:LOW QUALITY PROTEIN: coagulation factor X-like [Acridotheres tristis]
MGTAGHRGTMWLLPVVLLFLQMRQTGDCKIHVPAGGKPYQKLVITTGSDSSSPKDSNRPFTLWRILLETNRWQKVTGITANPDAHPENEESTEALSRQLESDYIALQMRVEKILGHAEFDTQTFSSSSSRTVFLKLEKPITFSEDVVPACLPEDFARYIMMNWNCVENMSAKKMQETPREPSRNGVCSVTGIISWGEGCGNEKYGIYTNLLDFLPVRSVLTKNLMLNMHSEESVIRAPFSPPSLHCQA